MPFDACPMTLSSSEIIAGPLLSPVVVTAKEIETIPSFSREDFQLD
jgi:hypothetical protein